MDEVVTFLFVGREARQQVRGITVKIMAEIENREISYCKQ
jgi:hypothetical protein